MIKIKVVALKLQLLFYSLVFGTCCNLVEDKKYNLSFVTRDNEDVEGYVNLLTEIQNRGVKEIGILVSNKHLAIKTAMNLIYPECTNFKQYFIYIKRSLLQNIKGRRNKIIYRLMWFIILIFIHNLS